MIKYEFMRAHGKGSEGSEKRGGAKIKRGCEKKGGAPHPPFFKKGGARSTGTPPVYATVNSKYILIFSSDDLNKELKNKF